MRRKRFVIALVLATCLGVAAWILPSRALAQQDAPAQAVPGRGGIPGATPGKPGSPGMPAGAAPQAPARVAPVTRGGWTLSDLLDGIVAMQAKGPRLSRAQAAKIKPALQRVIEASRLMTDAETKMKQILTPAQIAYIQKAQREGKLTLDTSTMAAKPGEDPVVAKVIAILEKKAH